MAVERATSFYDDPPISRALFQSTRFAWVWAFVRVWLGYGWVRSSLTKIGVEAWTGNGGALKGFWERVVQVPPPPARPSIAFDWYRSFIQYMLDTQSYTWFAKLVAYGELVVGLALIVGAFVGLAAFFGGFMNWNFMMAGTASTNPVLFTLAILLILGWKVAGHYGLDRYLLPLLGTPWHPGRAFAPGRQATAV